MTDEKIQVRCHGGPLDGRAIPCLAGELASGLVIAMSSSGRYEATRFRGYWSGEWIPAGERSAAEAAERLAGPNVAVTIAPGLPLQDPLAAEAARVGQGPAPTWHAYFAETGKMPQACNERTPALEHEYGPWGSTVRGSLTNVTRTCSRCGRGEFRIVAATVEGDPLEVSAALARDDEPPRDDD